MAEVALQGALRDSSKDQLMQKLKALCYSYELPFQYREIVFKSPPIPGGTPIEMRVRQDLEVGTNKKKGWSLYYSTSPILKTKVPVTVRTVQSVKVSENH